MLDKQQAAIRKAQGADLLYRPFRNTVGKTRTFPADRVSGGQRCVLLRNRHVPEDTIIATCERIQQENVLARLVMQVHDELVLEVKNDALDDVRRGVIERLSKAGELDVELLVEAGSGADWDSAH